MYPQVAIQGMNVQEATEDKGWKHSYRDYGYNPVYATE